MLNRIASLFRRRAFNIESLTVGHTETPGVSRMTILVDCDEHGARRLEANLLQAGQRAARARHHVGAGGVPRAGDDQGVHDPPESRVHVLQLVDVFRARVVDVAPDSVVIETTGAEEKIEGLLDVCCARTACWSWCAPGASGWCAVRAAS